MVEKIKFILSQAWEFLAPFIRILLTKAGVLLAETAMTVVQEVETSLTASDGAAKRAAAFEMIQQELKGKGIELAANVIYMAIEAAVSKIKN
ncbi:MAG: phage holin, LLH family [Desulfobacter sp.]